MSAGVFAELTFALLAFSALYWGSVAYAETYLELPWDA